MGFRKRVLRYPCAGGAAEKGGELKIPSVWEFGGEHGKDS